MEIFSSTRSYTLNGIVQTHRELLVYNAVCKDTLQVCNVSKIIKDPLHPKPFNPFYQLQNCKHEFLVRCSDIFEDAQSYYAVFELPYGKPISDALQQVGQMKEDRVANIVNQILSLVKYIHYKGFGLIKINPSTVYISSSDNVTVADYSFSASIGCNDRVKELPEHFENLPPEFFNTGTYVASQADIWSVGLLTYTLLTGNHPFLGNTPSYDHTEYTLKNALSQPVRVPSYINTMPANFIQRLLEIQPTRRFSIDQCQSHAWLAKVSRRITKMNSFNALNTLNDNNQTFRTNGLSILANKASPVRYNSQRMPNYRSFPDLRNPSEFDF